MQTISIETPIGDVQLPVSKKTAQNIKEFERQFEDETGKPYSLKTTVRWDDSCKNGYNTLSLTAVLYRIEASGIKREESGGFMPETIIRVMPELARAMPYHLVSADGPLHYIANTVFLAGDRDFNGCRAGEQRKSRKSGLPLWQKQTTPYSIVDAEISPGSDFQPLLGVGKARELALARSSAVWPTATDEELCVEPDLLTKKLVARLPALMDDFKAIVEELGFEY